MSSEWPNLSIEYEIFLSEGSSFEALRQLISRFIDLQNNSNELKLLNDLI